MKKKLTLLLAAFLVFSLGSCNKKDKLDTESSDVYVPSEVESDTESTKESESKTESESQTESESESEEDSESEEESQSESEEGSESESEGESESESSEEQAEDVYKVTFGSGSQIKGYNLDEAILDEDDVKAEVVKKYTAINLSLKAGDPIAFYLNEEAIQPGDEKSGGVDNGNNTLGDYPNYTVRQDAENASLYLKVYADGYSFWLTGYEKPADVGPYGPENAELVEWYIVGQGSLWDWSWDVATGVQMYTNPGNLEDKACVLNVTFAEGDIFKLVSVDNGDQSWNGYEKMNQSASDANAGSNCFAAISDGYGGENIQCVTAGTYDLYVQSTGLIWITYHTAA